MRENMIRGQPGFASVSRRPGFPLPPAARPRGAEALLIEVMNADSLAKKLLGMQLMVEPVALTIFQEIRRVAPEPVLAELLVYFERDEARHVAFGVYYLPTVVKDMSFAELTSLITWQLRVFMLELHGLKELKSDFLNKYIYPLFIILILLLVAIFYFVSR